ncbi:hypothetical protein MMC07_006584 [Pseudocyphellaria aurata]|nr:hypothetical protein [Pseudocyphellaria aurata]
MATQRGIQIQGPKSAKVVSDLPIPKLRDEYIIVKVAAVALNPADWMTIEYATGRGGLSGCDYAGTVEEVGGAVVNGLKKGDRVAGFTNGGDDDNHENGSFAEHIAAKGDVQLKIPDRLSFEDAATLGLGVVTVGQGLYQSLGLPLPTEATDKNLSSVLIYGGSTATGSLAIQFAKLSGLKVFTTCSPRNFDLVKSLGADFVFDHSSESCASEIRKASQDSIQHVFDCISTDASAKICADSVGPQGGKYSALLRVQNFPREDITTAMTFAATALGEPFQLGFGAFPAVKADYDFAVKFVRLATELLAEGKLKAHPADVRHGGLDGILDGLRDLQEKKVSGSKLVYQIN